MSDDPEPRGPSLALLGLLFVLAALFIAGARVNCGSASAQPAEAASTEPSDPLALAVMDLQPKLKYALAAKHVEWARYAATAHGVEVELLLALAFKESSFNPFAVSHRQCVTKQLCWKTGGVLYKPTALTRGPYYCGVMQIAVGHSWKACRARALDSAGTYLAGAERLVAWMNSPQCIGRQEAAQLRCALLGYTGRDPLSKSKSSAPERVLSLRNRIRRFVAAQVVT